VQKATCPSQQSLYAVFRGSRHLFRFLGIKRNTSRQLIISPPPTPRTVKCFGHSTVSVKEVAGIAFLLFTNSSPPLPIDLLELVALVAVAVALGIAIVIASRGSAALLRGLLGSRVPATACWQTLTEALALRAQVITSAGHVVSARSHGTVSLLATQRCSLRVSALSRSLEKR